MSTSEDKKEQSAASTSKGKTTPSPSVKELATKYMKVAADNAPEKFKTYIVKATPFVARGAELSEILAIHVYELYIKALAFWKSLEPYKPDLLIPSFAGLIMCFFGGSFLTLIAAVEAFKMCGYESTMRCVNNLIDDMKKVAEASKKDDDEDADGDGVADILQISSQELIKRKTLLFLKVVDPRRVTDALTGINAGVMAVVATLKLQFAMTITLGNSIATQVQAPADKYLVPMLEKLLPEEYRKWAQPLVSYSIKSAAISIAWTIQRIISAFHSAMRGGLMFSRNILHYLSVMKYVQIDHETTYLDEMIGYALAAVGLIFQLSFGFGLPFPLNIILFPFSVLEYLLVWFVNK